MAEQITAPSRVRKWAAIFPAETTPRTFLFFPALMIQLVASAVAGVGFSLNGRGFWLAGFILWLLWFAVVFAIIAPRTDALLWNQRAPLKKTAVTIFMLLIALGIVELTIGLFVTPALQRSGSDGDFAKLLEQMSHGFQYNDGTALGQQATENLLSGDNPYDSANIVTAMLKYGGSFDRVTPLRAGSLSDVFPYPTQNQLKQVWDTATRNPSKIPPEIESRVCYPAGSFLLPAPFIAAGITDIRIVYVIFVVAGLAYATWQIPRRRRLLFIAFAIVSLELWNSLADGETGSVVFPLLLIAWVSLEKNRWVSAIAMGLAVATKQTAWLFLPFYLILLWRESGTKSLALSVGVIGTVFFLMNAYFIALDPLLWLRSLLSPVTEPMFSLGVGVVALVESGLVNIQSPLPFMVLEALVFIAAVAWYIRNCIRYPHAGLILAILPLFFAWRSLWSYFFYVAIILLTRMLSEDRGDSAPALHPDVTAFGLQRDS